MLIRQGANIVRIFRRPAPAGRRSFCPMRGLAGCCPVAAPARACDSGIALRRIAPAVHDQPFGLDGSQRK